MSDDPAAWGAVPTQKDDDPASWGAKPSGGDFSWSQAVTDIPSEIKKEASAGASDVMALGRRGEMGTMEGLMSVPKAVIGAARVPLSPLTGAARSLVGHTMANLEHKAGEYIAPEIAAKDDPQKMYETAKGDVDTAMSAMAARRPVPASGPLPPPPRTIGDFDIPLTEGEATHDIGRISQERRALRSDAEGARAHEEARERFANRNQRIEDVRGEIGETFDPAGQTIAETPHQAAELTGQSLRDTARNVRDLSRTRYDEMRGLPGEFEPEAFTGIGNRIRTQLTHGAEPVIIDERTTPIAARAIQDIDEQIGHLRVQNLADPRGAPDPMDIVGINLNGVDQARKRLLTFYRDARGFPPTSDQRAMQAILRSFDDQIENSITRGLFSGDERALDALREARGLHSYYKRMFSPQGAGDDVGQAMQRILGRDGAREPATPTEIANMLYGTASVGAKGISYRLAERVRNVLGDRSPEWAGVKQGLWRRLTEAPEGKTDWGPEKVANRIAEFLNGDGRATAERMFSAPERETMQRFGDVLRQTVPPPGAVNYSNNVPMIAQVRDGLTKFMTAEIGAMIGGIPGAIAGWAVGTVGKPIADIAKARRIRQSMPTIQESVARWDRQIELALNGRAPSASALTAASTNLIAKLKNVGAPGELLERIRGVATTAAQNNQQKGQGKGDSEPDKRTGEKPRVIMDTTDWGKLHGGPVNRALGGAVNHNHNPSEAQKKAGNYAKTHKFFQGLDITIENLKGKARRGIGKDGKPWSVTMPANYGYLKRTEGADGDHVDCYLGPSEKSDQVFVVDQKDAETGKFDEHKCMLGFSSEKEARQTYRAGFSDGKDRIKHMRRMSMAEFRQWLEKGDTSKEIRRYATGGAVKEALPSLKEHAMKGMSMFKKGGRVTFGKTRSRSVALEISYRAKRERHAGRKCP